jgi:hypothetical protein
MDHQINAVVLKRLPGFGSRVVSSPFRPVPRTLDSIARPMAMKPTINVRENYAPTTK